MTTRHVSLEFSQSSDVRAQFFCCALVLHLMIASHNFSYHTRKMEVVDILNDIISKQNETGTV